MQRLADYEGLALFVKITEQGSISAVGRLLGLPKSTVSKRLGALEGRLGVQLINRTTRRLSLTDAGQTLLERARRVVHEVESIESEVAAKAGRPEGRVRVASPVGFGHAVLLPLTCSFLELYPAVSLEMSFLDRKVDMVAERFDLLVQYGEIADTSLHARHVMDYMRKLVASPSYIASAPPLTRLSDIHHHQTILLNADEDHWTLVENGDEVRMRVRSRLAVQNLLGIHRATIDGRGLALIPEYLIADDLRSGRLVHVLPEVGTPLVRASLLYPPSPVQPIAVRKLIEFVVERLRSARV